MLVFLLAACRPDGSSDNGDVRLIENPAPIDVTTPLGPGEARVGIVTEDDALFGGIAAEGRPGDYKIYNDRVRFIIQGDREGFYILGQGGMVIDADVVRPQDMPGRDLLDEWTAAVGVQRLVKPETYEVVDDGVESGTAVFRVEGPESALEYLTGSMESDGIAPDLGAWIRTEYTLPADSWFMEVTTTVTATEGALTFEPGDVMIGGKEVNTEWTPGNGLGNDLPDGYGWLAFVGDRNELTAATFSLPGDEFTLNAAVAVLNGLLAVGPAYYPSVTVSPGDSFSWTRLYGLAPDPATLTDAWLERAGTPTETVSGTVEAPDGPVGGARVNVLVDDLPYTLAWTGDDGTFSARVPEGSDWSVLAEGRGPGFFPDLPEGAVPYAPYAADPAREEALQSLVEGAPAPLLAQGRGVANAEDPLLLEEPGTLVVRTGDGRPFETRVRRLDSDDAVAEGLAQERPDGYAALAWAKDGEVSFPVEAGTYEVVTWRGPRWEVDQAEVTIVAGEEAALDVTLALAWSAEGWMSADPHSHAAPSPDGGVSMEERMLIAAATGVQLQFGTDHDHIADYSPLVEPLGIGEWTAAVAACEVSPLRRGHINAYPLVPDAEAPNGGAFLWWKKENRVETTQEQFDRMAVAMPGALFQVNHPLSGLASFAGWSPGHISRPDYWTEDFDAIEVNNGGSHDEYMELYFDLVNRGLLPTPTGVSDSHSHLSSHPGLNVTWLGIGIDDPREYTPSALVDAFTARRTVPSTGPFIELSIPPGSTVTGHPTLQARAISASWIIVDRLVLYENGQIAETVDGTDATFELDAATDATYVVVAEGDGGMYPITSTRPWAMTSAILLDVEGDGWEPPLPPLTLE